MTPEERQGIRKMQAVLQSIDNGKPTFFNVTLYKKLGLVTVRNKWGTNAGGRKINIGYTFHLTPKGKRCLQVLV